MANKSLLIMYAAFFVIQMAIAQQSVELITTTYTLGDFVFTVAETEKGLSDLAVKNIKTNLLYKVDGHTPIQKIYGADLDNNGSKEFLILNSWCLHCKGLEIVAYKNTKLEVSDNLFFDYMQADFEFTDIDQNGTLEIVAYESMPSTSAYYTQADYVSVYNYINTKIVKNNKKYPDKVMETNNRLLAEIARLSEQNDECNTHTYEIKAKLYALLYNYYTIDKKTEGKQKFEQYYGSIYDADEFRKELNAKLGYVFE